MGVTDKLLQMAENGGVVSIPQGGRILISILFLSSCWYVRGLELATSKTAVVTDLTQVPRALPEPQS